MVNTPSSSTDKVEELAGQKSQSRKRKTSVQGSGIIVKKQKGQCDCNYLLLPRVGVA